MKKNLSLGMIALSAYAYAATVFAGAPPVAVPEPGTLGLLAAGIAAVVAVRLIKRK